MGISISPITRSPFWLLVKRKAALRLDTAVSDRSTGDEDVALRTNDRGKKIARNGSSENVPALLKLSATLETLASCIKSVTSQTVHGTHMAADVIEPPMEFPYLLLSRLLHRQHSLSFNNERNI